MGVINSFIRLKFVTVAFVINSLLKSFLIGVILRPLGSVVDEAEAKALYQLTIPITDAVSQTLLSTFFVGAVGTLFESGTLAKYSLAWWSADAAVGGLVATAVFKFAWDAAGHSWFAWLTPIAAILGGTFIINLREKAAAVAIPKHAEEIRRRRRHRRRHGYSYGRFICIFVPIILFKAGLVGYRMRIAHLFWRTDAIFYGVFIHDVIGGFGGELVAALVPNTYVYKYQVAMMLLYVASNAMVLLDAVFHYGINEAVSIMLFISGVSVQATGTLFREAGGLLDSTTTGMPMGESILILDLAGVAGLVLGNLFTKLWDWGFGYFFPILFAQLFNYLEPKDNRSKRLDSSIL